ncbi:hypothetical protein DFJ64_0697 [Thermasporomyces composti]|uniref:Uncharacterized protein n=2 Tax=Thermasporomyces composti TaxID=696763 RepID=A0A3D9VDE8_THECX|nr:hypothetical protein DFJ64_0697 [Thermasporomyces composti]
MGEAPTITLGGDPASIRAVADWFRSTLAPLVEEASRAVGYILCNRLDSWDDLAGRAFAERLGAGLVKINQLSDAIRVRARLLDRMADALEMAQNRVEWATDTARREGLRIEDGCIWPPKLEIYPPGHSEDYSLEAANLVYRHRKQVYEEITEQVDSAHDLIREMLVGDDTYNWNAPLFLAGDIVSEEASALVDEIKRKKPRLYSSLTGRILLGRGASAALTITSVGYSLYEGEPPEKVVLITGVAIATAAVIMGVGTYLGAPFWLTPIPAAILGNTTSQYVGKWYDKQNRTALEKLLAVTPSLDPGPRRVPPVGEDS